MHLSAEVVLQVLEVGKALQNFRGMAAMGYVCSIFNFRLHGGLERARIVGLGPNGTGWNCQNGVGMMTRWNRVLLFDGG